MELDSYVIDTLMPDLVGHDKRPSALLVYLYLWAKGGESRARRAEVSLREIAEGTGLSKRSVQVALRLLDRRKLVARGQTSRTSVGNYEVLRPWKKR
ncbi:MAG TPA: helix-turn-helix domain-containing protein [Gemmatimonadaceae bacterium]|jgi:DNA-binding MarR family transcriptional regulator|nr:helix-turn-helix domain-containing protein [Gemmatimonadaceae bacterium]